MPRFRRSDRRRDPHVIDLITLDEEANVARLVLLEPGPWDGSREHLLFVQERLNACLAFGLDGELVERYPEAARAAIVIRLETRHEPDAESAGFLSQARDTLREAGVGLEVEVVTE